jgi:serine protease Do
MGGRQETSAQAATRRLTWLFGGLAAVLLLRFLVPYLAEQVQYAITRGKQRAEMEAAEKGLSSLQLSHLSKAYQYISQLVAPSVVNINVLNGTITEPQDDLSALFAPPSRQAQGQGSGVIVESDGYILTNSHVVRGATEIQVGLLDGRVLRATVVGNDSLTDLALLKVDANELIAVKWGDSNEIDTGALVWAVGSPFGLQQSITAGILSGKNRPGNAGAAYYEFLQTDAAVNPGNSGGPLVDAQGRVVGINTAIVGDVFQGISFAIPSNEARHVYEQLRTKGRVERGWLGVALRDVDASTAKQFAFPGTQGALVQGVTRNSPAAVAGLQTGDIIMRWNGQEVRDGTILSRLVARTKVGSTVEVVVWRHARQMTINVNIIERPAELDRLN